MVLYKQGSQSKSQRVAAKKHIIEVSKILELTFLKSDIINCNYMLIHKAASAKRQRAKNFLVFESSCQLPPAYLSTSHGGGFIYPFLLLNVTQESCENQLLWSLVCLTGNRTRIYNFSSRLYE